MAFAYSPILRAGLLVGDYALLLGAPPQRPPPLGSWWTRASSFLWGLPGPGASAWPFRLENLLVLTGAALAARSFLVRLFAPWMGSAQARVAAWAASSIALLHPLAPPAIAGLEARGELLGLLFALAAGALFLRGRQEERDGLTAASLVLLSIGGLGSSVALAIVPVLAAAEFLSARRHRKRTVRWRTSLTTAGVFGSGALLALLVAPGHVAVLPAAAGGDLVQRLIEELGRLVIPTAPGAGALSAVLAGGLLLLALVPAFRAARNAPRLWGNVLVAWSAVLALALLHWSAVTGAECRQSGELLALLVFSSGLGLAATSLAGSRAVFACGLLVAGQAALAHGNARPWLACSGAIADLRAEIRALGCPAEARLLVLDPSVPGPVSAPDELGWLFHPRLEGAGEPSLDFDPRHVRGLSSAAFLALARTEAFARLRSGPLTVVALAAALGQPGEQRLALEIPPAAPVPIGARWNKKLSFTPDQPLDPLAYEGLRVIGDLTSAASSLDRLGWRAEDGEGSLEGTVRESGGRREALFDLSGSLAWRLSGAVRSVRVEKGVRDIEHGEFLVRLPELEGLGPPAVSGPDWLFARPRTGHGASRDGRYELALLALSDLELLELPLEPDPSGGLRARGAERFAASKTRAGAPVEWSVDYRIGAHALARSRGTVTP